MDIKHAYPPNYEQIAKVFGKAAIRNAVFTYGQTIYTPKGLPIPGHLIHHEKVHMKQHAQTAGGPDFWWSRYLDDPEFRLSQEVEAYRAQYRYVLKNHGREDRRQILSYIVRSLASPMYGNLVTKDLARKLITED